MACPDPPVLDFDDISLDLAGRRLLRAGQVQPLEPKAFAVLCLLARSPGQVFSRDEILDAVWGHRHVTPGVLNRIITLLRHALGEDAQHPRYLHTVHGYGYRFDRPVAAAVAATDAPADAATGRPVADDTPGPAAPDPRGGDTPVGDTRRRPRGPPWLRAALAVVLVLGVGVWGWRWMARDAAPSPSAAVAAPVLAVLPLRALGDDPRGQAFADGLSEEPTGLLAHIDGLRVTSRTSSFRFRNTELPVADIAHRLQATHVLEGSVRQTANACASACASSRPAAIARCGGRSWTASCATASNCSATSPTRSPTRCNCSSACRPAPRAPTRIRRCTAAT